MADPTPDEALALLHDVLGGAVVRVTVLAKCPYCTRMLQRDPYLLTQRCVLCTLVDGYGTLMDLMLAKEFGLSMATYHARLEKYGPPWISPKEWIQPRSKWWKLRPPDDDSKGGVHTAPATVETDAM